MSSQIKNLIQNIIKDINNNESWKIYLLSNWNSILGNLSSKIKLEKIYEDTLLVSVFDSSWMQELFLLSNIIIKNINSKLDKPRIKHLRFKLSAQIPAKKVVEKKVEVEKVINLNSKELIALSKIEDSELNELLKRYLIRCYKQR